MYSKLLIGIAAGAFATLALAGCSAQSSAGSDGGSGAGSAASKSSSSSSSSKSAAGDDGYGTSSKSGGSKSGGGHGADDGIGTASTSLGTIVVDGAGMTAYYYDKDVAGSGTSTCSGECAAAWPAIESDSTTPAVTGVTGKVGTITGIDGKPQVTVEGRPIYTFAQDAKPGDVTGQGVGTVWYVVNPDGSEQK